MFEQNGRRREGAWPAGRMMAQTGWSAKRLASGSLLERTVGSHAAAEAS